VYVVRVVVVVQVWVVDELGVFMVFMVVVVVEVMGGGDVWWL
jgi:Flp pilus assembly protein protease CpaA